MSRLPKKILLPNMGNLRAKAKTDFERELLRWVQTLYDNLQKNHQEIFEFAEAGGWGLKSWRAKEADAADVAAGDANAVGDLLEQQKVSGVWITRRINLGS